MPPLGSESAKITADAIARSNWTSIIPADSRALCSAFQAGVKQAEERDDGEVARFFAALMQVTSMGLREDDHDGPYVPMWRTPEGRSAIPSDFTEEELDVFASILGKSDTAPLDARIADVLWIRRRDHKHARLAIGRYAAQARQELDASKDHWISGCQALHRGAQLWIQLGRPNDEFALLSSTAEGSLEKTDLEPKDYFRVKTLRIIADFQLTANVEKWRNLAAQWAKGSKEARHFEKARAYLEIAQGLSKSAPDAARQFEFEIMRCFVDEARHVKAAGAAGLLVADRYSKAIEACRRVGGQRALIDELHKELNSAQKDALRDFARITTTVDLSEPIRVGRQQVEGVPDEQALLNIAGMASPGPKAAIRKDVIDAAGQFPLQSFISSAYFDEKGRLVARKTPILTDDPREREAGIEAEMMRQISLHQSTASVSMIEAARQVLNHRTISSAGLFGPLVTMNPFVPPGREALFVRGLGAGLRGDWITCLHVLIPQIENSIRHVMEENGYLVTHLGNDLVQMEFDLNCLLRRPEADQLFGEDEVYDLRVLLIEQAGKNLRNKMAHGLLSAAHLKPDPVNFLWAKTILLCQIGKALASQGDKYDGS